MRKLCIYICIVVLSLGCVDFGEGLERSPRANYDALWRMIDSRYCFLSYKSIDWSGVYWKYLPLIEAGMSDGELFDVLGMMLNELRDGHTNLVSDFGVSRYSAWYEDYAPNFDEGIQSGYLGEDYLMSGGIVYTILRDVNVGYIYYSSFTEEVLDSELDGMLSYFSNCSGLIIDIRNNGGGSLGYADRLASRFVSERMLAGYIYHKVGSGHDDFSARYPVYIEPSSGVHWLGRVCILTNRHSYSASNDFVSKMGQLPLVTVIGDRTGGGGGLPVNAELPNGWTVRYSSSPLLNALGEHIESGIDPDIWSSMLSADVSQNLDTIIECAISLLTADPQ